MSLFFETIRFQKGEFSLLDYHEERLNRTREQALGDTSPVYLQEILKTRPQDDQLYRCRVVFGRRIEEISFLPYKIARHTTISFFSADNYDYAYKSLDRGFFNRAVEDSQTDDVIFLKNGWLTDASYANLAFFDGKSWITPKHFLLAGVKRRFLLEKGSIAEREISLQDLPQFSRIAFINAMRDFELVYSFRLEENKMHLTLIE